MSEVKFNYEHIEYAQELFNIVAKHFDWFDWTWVEWDWKKNWLATMKCIREYERELRTFPVEIVYYEQSSDCDWADWYFDVRYYEPRLHTYVSCWEVEWIDNHFDYMTPLDVLSLLNDLIDRRKEMASIYIIKPN